LGMALCSVSRGRMSLPTRLARGSELAAEREGAADVADAGAGRARSSPYERRARSRRPRPRGKDKALLRVTRSVTGRAGPAVQNSATALREPLALQLRHGRFGTSCCPSLRKIFSFPPSSVPEEVLAIPCTGGAGRVGEVHEMASKKSLTTGRHASRARFDAGEGSMSFHVDAPRTSHHFCSEPPNIRDLPVQHRR
jgi:hypothetical protein